MTAWRMPAEWEPHERTWMAWPSAGYTLGDTEAEADEARRTWAAVARAVARFEPVTMVVTSPDVSIAVSFDLHDHQLALVRFAQAVEDVRAQIAQVGPTRQETP